MKKKQRSQFSLACSICENYPDSKVHGVNMGPIWGRQDPGGPHVGPMNIAIWVYTSTSAINTLRPRQNGRHLSDDTFKRIFLNENVIILIKISLKFVPYGPINNIPSLVQIMAWHLSGNKPLSEPIMGSLPTHICVPRAQCVNSILFGVQYILCKKILPRHQPLSN